VSALNITAKLPKNIQNFVSGPNGDVFLVVLLFIWYSFRCDNQYRRDFWGGKNTFICISLHSDMHSHEIVRHATSSKWLKVPSVM